MPVKSAEARRRRLRPVAAMTAVLAAVLAVQGGLPAAAAGGPHHGGETAGLRARHHLGTPPRSRLIRGWHARPVARHGGIRARQVAAPAPAPAWPTLGTATVAVPAASPGLAPASGAVAWASAGRLPVSLAAAPAAGAHMSASPSPSPSASTAATAGAGVSRVRVSMLGRAAASAAGVHGLLFTLARADGGTAAGTVQARISYTAFAHAYGGGYGPRLNLVAMPGCALTTPAIPACQAATPVATANDARAQTLTATLAAAPAGQPGLAYAATASTSGGSGDFKATSLSPSSMWNVGLQYGDFTWSYPLRVPPPIAGASPSLALAYDSAASDGETAQDNSQPGQVGEGFALAGGGFIERKYASCGDMITGKLPGWSNNTDQAKATGDLCWHGYNGFLSLGGHSGQLVRDNSTGAWRLENDPGWTVKLLSGASNGAYNGSYWEVIAADGTQYYFGLNHLPGYATDDAATNSAWTVPVVGLASGDPCHNAHYSSSYCANMAWRWNLDLVVDPNGNAAGYFYAPQANYYAYDSTATTAGSNVLSYTMGGTLADIYYGAQDNSANGSDFYAHLPFDVHFGYSDRCTSTNQTTCNSNKNGTYWPDTPWDLYCASKTGCTGSGHNAPAFFDTLMLTSATTKVDTSSAYQNTDTWTLAYQWLAADVNSDLVLASVTHAGDDGTTALPPVTFGYTSQNNQIYSTTKPKMARYRLTSVTSETGAQTDVGYNQAACASGSPPTASTNTWPCFPQFYTGGDFGGSPTTLWFYKFTVHQVLLNDSAGGEPTMSWTYGYGAAFPQGAAWHYDTDIDMVPPKDKSYAQWRGYQNVSVVTGATGGTQSEADYTFLRGMDHDPLPGGGFSSVTVTDSRGDTVTDAQQLNGSQLEKITLNGPGGPQVADQVSLPWLSPPTATSATQPWGGTLTANMTATAQTDGYAPLSAHAGGGTRHVQAKYTHDNATGLITQANILGDLAATGQALCTAYSYPSPASSAGLLDYPTEVKTTAGACGTTSPPLVSDTRYLYDGQAWGTAPTAGNVTETDMYSAGDPGVADHWIQQSRGGYDSYGRLTSAKDAAGNTTTTGYTSSYGTGLATTQVSVTDPLSHQTVIDINPNWGIPNDSIDPAGQRTDYAFDPLGRVTSIWLPGQTGATRSADGTANYQFAYSVTSTAAPYVTTTRLIDSFGDTVTAYQILDSLLRPRQTQIPAEGAQGGVEVTDTFYDSRGLTVTQNGPYAVGGRPSGAILAVTESQVPDETTTSYDGAGRITESDLYTTNGALVHKTTLAYPGADAVVVTPPTGGTITATYADGLGRTAEIDQYHSQASASGPYDATSYGYTPAGMLASVTDAGGNQWSYTHDLLGRQISATDPDTGTSTQTWNDLGQLISATDAAGHTISWTYDTAGRQTADYAAPVSGQSASNQLAAWSYDTAGLDNPALPSGSKATGQLASATSYVGGTGGEAYQQVIGSYAPSYQPDSATYVIPQNAVTGALGGTQPGGSASYQFGYTYRPDGALLTQSYPAAGGLTAETVNDGMNSLGSPYSLWSTQSDYAEGSYYTADYLPAEIDLGTSSSAQWSRMLISYDPATRRLSEARIQRESTSWANDSDISYGYDQAGDVTSLSDAATSDNQCFQYDYLQRLTAAWAQAAASCPASPPGASGLGGPAPYQQTLAYDNGGAANGSTSGTTGLTTSDTLITGTGSSATTTQVAYAYPGYGATQPHAPTGYTTTVNGNATATTQTWTTPGQLATSQAGGTTTSYTWDGAGMPPGQLAAVTTGGTATAAYRYDATGNLLLVQNAGATTLHLPGEELTATASTVTATRYYTLGGRLIAARTPAGLDWLISDPHGTATTTVDTATQNLAHRYYTPFGQPRGTAPPSWPGTRGFAGGTTDTGTGLTNLGAREYNPAAPAFISPDPLPTPYQPATLDPYAYAAGNPATNADPSGLCSQTWCPQNANRATPDPTTPAPYNPPPGGGCGPLGWNCAWHFITDAGHGIAGTTAGLYHGAISTITQPIHDIGNCLSGSPASCGDAALFVFASPAYALKNTLTGAWDTGTAIYHEAAAGHPGEALGTLLTLAAALLITKKLTDIAATTAPAPEDAGAAGAKLFTSPDPHVADAVNAIQSAMPGRVLGVNGLVPMANGLSREADINLGDLLVQVKSGNARGLIGQIQQTGDTTGIRTIGYAPSMPSAAWASAAEQGVPIARNIDELIAIIREFG